MTALVLAIGYLLLALMTVGWLGHLAGIPVKADPSPVVGMLLAVNLVGFLWRAGWRFLFTAREYGVAEGARAVLRIPLSNVIAIMAGRRALGGYVASLSGRRPSWDKTHHTVHPAMLRDARGAA
jgi:adsorption protein B